MIDVTSLVDHPRFRCHGWLLVRVYLLANAAESPRQAVFGGKVITLERGQLVASRSEIAEATGLHPSTVQRVMGAMRSENEIDQQANNRSSLITVTYLGAEKKSDQPAISQRSASDQPSRAGASDASLSNQVTGSQVTSPPLLQNGKNHSSSGYPLAGGISTKPSAKKKKKRAYPPLPKTVEEVIEVALRKVPPMTEAQAVRFWEFYQCKGWMIGKNKMIDWHTALGRSRSWADDTPAARQPSPGLQLKVLDELMANHPANSRSPRYREGQVTTEQVQDLKGMIVRRNELARRIAEA